MIVEGRIEMDCFRLGLEWQIDGMAAFISWPGRTGRCRSRWSVRALSKCVWRAVEPWRLRHGKTGEEWRRRRCSEEGVSTGRDPKKSRVDPLDDAQTGRSPSLGDGVVGLLCGVDVLYEYPPEIRSTKWCVDSVVCYYVL